MQKLSKGEHVERHTSNQSLNAIKRETMEDIKHFSSDKALLDQRIKELGKEWDVERNLEMTASLFALTGLLLGTFSSRKWLLVPGLVLPFLFQHALMGWCPPLPIFRKLGKRTRSEIDHEKYALKALRGDFSAADNPHGAYKAVLNN